MKKRPTLHHRFKQVVALTLAGWAIAGVFLLSGCGQEKTVPAPVVAVDSTLEMVPPIAGELSIQELKDNDEGNLLVVASLDRTNIKGQFHALNLSTGTVTLRDDGQGGDETANDGRFSVILKEDIAEIASILDSAESARRELLAKPQLTFRGRQLVRPDVAALEKFQPKDFRSGKLVRLPAEVLCRLFRDVSIPHSLMVTDLGVVEDPSRSNVTPCDQGSSAAKAWTFGKLMTDMANEPLTGVSGQDFVKHWLNIWLNPVTVNGETVPDRDRMFTAVIQPWVIASGAAPGSFTINDWMTKPLDLDKAPFKLTAIVNRLDLRGNSGYGMSNAGEGRFVFEFLQPNCTPFAQAFNVIFEYGVPIRNCAQLKTYAQDWYDLKSLQLGGTDYNNALQRLTDVFALANAAPQKPNGSAINQIRTNEISLSTPWELREFNIDPSTHQLFQTTVKQEPAEKYNQRGGAPGTAAEIALMADWVNTHAQVVKQDRHKVPLSLPSGEPFLGAKARTDGARFWDAAPLAITDDEARHHFSLNTCSGCHGSETATGFVHVTGPQFGTEATLSSFLTGGPPVPDPAGRPSGAVTTRSFADLARRQQDLETLLCSRCGNRFFELIRVLSFRPLNMTH